MEGEHIWACGVCCCIHLVICTSGFQPSPDTYHQIIAFPTPEEPDLLAVCSLVNTSLLCLFVNMFIEIVIRTVLVMFRYQREFSFNPAELVNFTYSTGLTFGTYRLCCSRSYWESLTVVKTVHTCLKAKLVLFCRSIIGTQQIKLLLTGTIKLHVPQR